MPQSCNRELTLDATKFYRKLTLHVTKFYRELMRNVKYLISDVGLKLLETKHTCTTSLQSFTGCPKKLRNWSSFSF